jgi:hypothetical protein
LFFSTSTHHGKSGKLRKRSKALSTSRLRLLMAEARVQREEESHLLLGHSPSKLMGIGMGMDANMRTNMDLEMNMDARMNTMRMSMDLGMNVDVRTNTTRTNTDIWMIADVETSMAMETRPLTAFVMAPCLLAMILTLTHCRRCFIALQKLLTPPKVG